MQGRTVGVHGVRVDDSGIWAQARQEAILDVLFDSRRIWSFWLHRDGVRVDRSAGGRGGEYLVEWPHTLREFLCGSTRVTLRLHDTGATVYDEEVTLAVRGRAAPGTRIQVVNAAGRPLALDKSLRRVQTFDTRSRANVEPLIRAIDNVVGTLRRLDVTVFLAYGTLLGAVRNGQLIGHDSDADLGYLSAFDHPVDVARESFRIQRALVEEGYRVTRYSGAAFKVDVIESDGSVRGLDVFGGFLMGGRLHLMGEIRTPFEREWILPLGTTTLEGTVFPAPADTDRFLQATYGAGWRTPDPAFHFATPMSTHRRFNGWFRGIRTQRALWDRVYAADRPRHRRPSDTASWIARQDLLIDSATHFVDLGCGFGVDAWWMAKERGIPATGLDFVPRAFARVADRSRREQVDAEFLNFNLLELRSVLGVSALIAARPGPRVLQARHLVDAIGPQARRNLWRAASMMLRDGGSLCLQFLTHAGDDGYARANRLRPRNPHVVAGELRSAGATIVSRTMIPVTKRAQVNELTPPDPSTVCRMVVQWTR